MKTSTVAGIAFLYMGAFATAGYIYGDGVIFWISVGSMAYIVIVSTYIAWITHKTLGALSRPPRVPPSTEPISVYKGPRREK
jgi:hypothetical protein